MTPRVLVQSILRHEETERLPYNFMFSPPAEARLKAYYGVEDLQSALDINLLVIGPKGGKPLYAFPQDFGETITDPFGVVWSTSKRDRGYPISHPLRTPSLEGYTFPLPPGPERFEEVRQLAESSDHFYRLGVVADFWERAHFMRGLEEILIDVRLHRQFLEQLLDHLFEYNLAVLRRYKGMPFEAMFWSDDYGLQQDLMIAPEDWRYFIKPRLAALFSETRKMGFNTMLHSCGCVRKVIPDLIEIGLDILHPIQPETMDIFELKREFGRDITFCGGVNTQQLLPFGTPEEIRQEVKRIADFMGKGGGYILEPGITLQADIPVENLVALVEAAQNYRRF